MMNIDRRSFLTLAGATAASTLLAPSLLAEPLQDFDFIFFTDTHLEPELNGVQGCDMAFKKMRRIKADFAIQGGDHIMDSMAVPKARLLSLFDMYDKSQQDTGLKVYHTLGNHDLVGIKPESGMQQSDPLYGKKFFSDHYGKTFYSFDHKGVHFIVLDSVRITDDHNYIGFIDDAQLTWLAADLAAQPATKPIIVTSHMPIITAYTTFDDGAKPAPPSFLSVTNSNKVYPLFHGHNVLAVLQGHTHVNERVEFQGVSYLTSGAVCGNWWRGTHLGTPEGYTIVSLRNGKLTTRYETYGFHTIDPRNT